MDYLNLATWFVRIESVSKAGGHPVVITNKIVIVDAHSEIEAEVLAARIAFAGPEALATVTEHALLTRFGLYKKFLAEAKDEYDHWIGQFEHAKSGYYERKPKKSK